MRYWSDKAKQYLLDNAATMTVMQLVRGLKDSLGIDKSRDAVYLMCYQLNTKPKSNVKGRWSDEEIQFLKDNYSHMTYKELSKALGRTDQSVRCKIRKVQSTLEQVTPWMDTMLAWVRDKKSICDMSIELHDSGHRVDVRTNAKGKFALFAN